MIINTGFFFCFHFILRDTRICIEREHNYDLGHDISKT